MVNIGNSLTDDDLETRQKLIQILDNVLTEGVWSGSLFLEAWGKKIQDLRNSLMLESQTGSLQQDNITATTALPLSNSLDVYILLYQATGLNFKKWEVVLNSIASYSSGRPIYKNESDAELFIRSKENKQNDGYAVIRIKPADILTAVGKKPAVDRSGKELLMLKEGAIKPQNIIRFVHITGIYHLENGRLIKLS